MKWDGPNTTRRIQGREDQDRTRPISIPERPPERMEIGHGQRGNHVRAREYPENNIDQNRR
jgi:hypothetical protein